MLSTLPTAFLPYSTSSLRSIRDKHLHAFLQDYDYVLPSTSSPHHIIYVLAYDYLPID